MTRPSIKEKRTEEILQAYERCISLYGVEGATLQKIAEEAKIARPLLRHNIGNRDDLLQMAVKRFIHRSEQAMQEAYAVIPKDCRGEDFVYSLFYSTPSNAQHSDVMIAAALIYAAQTDPNIKKEMQRWLSTFIEGFTNQLQRIYPRADIEHIQNVTAGIVGIYFNVESLAPLGTNKSLRDQSYQSALYLLTALKNQKD